MAVRQPLYLDSGNNLREMTTAMVTEIVNQVVYQYSINPSVSLSVVNSGGTLGTITDTRLSVVDPTAVRQIALPDADGTVALTNTTGYATGSIFSSTSTLIIYDSTGTELKRVIGSAT